MIAKAWNVRAAAALAAILLSVPFAAFAETECRRFNPHNLEIAEMFGKFGLVEHGEPVVQAGTNRAEARVALFVIVHYRINEVCGVGGLDRPVMTYFLTNGSAPRGTSPGEDCVRFDQTGSRLYEQGGYWILADRNQDIIALGRDQALAEEAVVAIRTRRFSEICYIGGANAALTYFLY